jgi:hypothetical protein
MDVLPEPNQGRLAHCLIGPAAEIFYYAIRNFGRESRFGAWLKERQVVEAIALIIDDNEAVNLLMR